jgi:two-component system, NarL family, sensor histidine kinase FusK
MKSNIWVSLLLWILVWLSAITVELAGGSETSAYLFSMMALFFVAFFFMSVAKSAAIYLLCIQLVSITLAFLFPLNEWMNPFVSLMFLLLLLSCFKWTSGRFTYIFAIAVLLASFLTQMEFLSITLVSFYLLLATILIIAIYEYYKYFHHLSDIEQRYQALLHTYKKLKRDTITHDQLTRQQERLHIGREIHDRVGHTLTNLLMQIEILHLKDGREEWNQVKVLAQESLQETRKAVKALKEDSVTGIAAIIQLIRKLEAEQYISITFSMRQNALSITLSPDQATVVYRAIQESLTNIMRHSAGKEATVLLEAPGSATFRFEVTNPLIEDIEWREGFGIQSMRDRLQQIGGELDIFIYQHNFVVRGSFPLKG